MFRIAISAIALSGVGTVALVTHATGGQPATGSNAVIEATATEATVPQTPPSDWGAPPINPVATIKAALADFGPIPARATPTAARGSVGPIRNDSGVPANPPSYTMHPAIPAAAHIVPVRLGEGFSAEQRGQIIQALKEWNQVLNGFVRVQIVGPKQVAAGTWLVRAVGGAAPSPNSAQSLQTLAYTHPQQAGGGTVLVYTERLGSFDLTKVMRHEFGHALGLPHDPHGGVMAARYSEHAQECIDRHTAASAAAAWRLPLAQLNWCE